MTVGTIEAGFVAAADGWQIITCNHSDLLRFAKLMKAFNAR